VAGTVQQKMTNAKELEAQQQSLDDERRTRQAEQGIARAGNAFLNNNTAIRNAVQRWHMAQIHHRSMATAQVASAAIKAQHEAQAMAAASAAEAQHAVNELQHYGHMLITAIHGLAEVGTADLPQTLPAMDSPEEAIAALRAVSKAWANMCQHAHNRQITLQAQVDEKQMQIQAFERVLERISLEKHRAEEHAANLSVQMVEEVNAHTNQMEGIRSNLIRAQLEDFVSPKAIGEICTNLDWLISGYNSKDNPKTRGVMTLMDRAASDDMHMEAPPTAF